MRKTFVLLVITILPAFAQVRPLSPTVPLLRTFAQMTAISSPATEARVTVTDCLAAACTVGGGSISADFKYTGAAWALQGTGTQIVAPAGTFTNPGISFVGNLNNGFFNGGSYEIWMLGGTASVVLLSGEARVPSGTCLTFSSATDGFSNSDTSFCRDSAGVVSTPGGMKAATYRTVTNCADSAGAAACGSAASGAFVIDAATTSTVVSTTAVTANSRILLTNDPSLGTALGITCNTQTSIILGSPYVSARTAGTSFTAAIDVAPTATPRCISYQVIN